MCILDSCSTHFLQALVQLSNISTAITRESDPEKILLNGEVLKLRTLVKDQGEHPLYENLC